jgi:formylglycine-generating enzyme required for sulfatase activity
MSAEPRALVSRTWRACASVLAAMAALAPAGCGSPATLPAEGHLVIVLDTDAPLPSSSGTTVGVFDSVELAVLDDAGDPACSECAREVGITQEAADRGATFVVRNRQPAVLRARLFSSRLGVASRDPATTVEHWVRLPPSPAEGETRVVITLPLEQIGIPLGSLASPTGSGDPDAPLARQPVDTAATDAGPGEVCVQGGWFWMGDPRLPPEAGAPTLPGAKPTPGERTASAPQLVHIASFCVDEHELTVRELRALGMAKLTATVAAWSGTTSTSNLASFCTFTAQPGPNDDRPVVCVPWDAARAACRARGMDLPTEAQLEYLGRAFGRSSFVWGQETPSCDDAFLGRAVPPLSGDTSCTRGARAPLLPSPTADVAASRDVLDTPGGSVIGLAANVSEWTREAFEPRTAACRGPQIGPARDPECAPDAKTTRIAVRGGNLASTPAEAAAALRAFVALPKIRPDLGFRCVR